MILKGHRVGGLTGDCDRFLPRDIILQAGVVYHSKPQWMILNGQRVGGSTVY